MRIFQNGLWDVRLPILPTTTTKNQQKYDDISRKNLNVNIIIKLDKKIGTGRLFTWCAIQSNCIHTNEGN